MQQSCATTGKSSSRSRVIEKDPDASKVPDRPVPTRIKKQVERLIAVQCDYQNAGYHQLPYQWGPQSAIAADHLRAGAPLRKNRPARRTA